MTSENIFSVVLLVIFELSAIDLVGEPFIVNTIEEVCTSEC